MNTPNQNQDSVTGAFVSLGKERYYLIENIDRMQPFFISVVSNADHWLFVASNGGLTAGRESPDTALFPYVTVDKLYDSTAHTGSKTVLRVEREGRVHSWEPFNREHDERYSVTRNLYKNTFGNKLLFEEINHALALTFRYSWRTSEAYGFVRSSELSNLGKSACRVELVDGLQNILPAGTPRFTQTNSSYLVDAYKWQELHGRTGLGMFTLFSGISDRAEPCESLRATTVFCLGLEGRRVLLSSAQLDAFRRGGTLQQEDHKRGVRGAYLVNAAIELAPSHTRRWQIVADVEQNQRETVALIHELREPDALAAAIEQSIERGDDGLARIIGAGDGHQLAAEEIVTAHHYANVLFNVLRGGIVADQYRIHTRDFRQHLARFNAAVAERHSAFLHGLPETLEFAALLAQVRTQADSQLERLTYEYLPITFGRRHGDPSRPWNQFAIRLKDEHGEPLLTYQGNWRDIFQNWEALLLSFPELIENVIAKFVNASTVDGYNPYRITNDGIDWEVEDPEDPWSYIGYWGDHQIIYLQKLLELSQHFHPARLGELLHSDLFSYANVPYRIRPLDALLKDAKSTVDYDEALALRVEERVARLGADGKMLPGKDGGVYQVNLLEKLLVTLLAKLGNLVVDGGIWLNTQRPEWNDANNALVGQGLSMVTLYYLRRYVRFLEDLLESADTQVRLSAEVATWLDETATALRAAREHLGGGPLTAHRRHELLVKLGTAASHYRQSVYAQEGFSGSVTCELSAVVALLEDAQAAIDHSISTNRLDSGLYHAYNLLELTADGAEVDTLYPMLEGQVAALSSGAIEPEQAITLLEALFASDVYRADQKSFLLYPDRDVPRFLDKNRVPAERVASIPLLVSMLEAGDRHIVARDADGVVRFHPDLTSVGELNARLDELAASSGDQLDAARAPLRALYEDTFRHQAFTGRSGGMFGFEGLGSIYWHMVAKLLLAVQETFFRARDKGADQAVCARLGTLYYRVREGIGFNKTPAEYGAFPFDPYSHSPSHSGAQQPGMTGQVKEEMLTRLAELGVRVQQGEVRFDPALLRRQEFLTEALTFRHLDAAGVWQELPVPASALAFTWCQVPVIYRQTSTTQAVLSVTLDDGTQQDFDQPVLPSTLSAELFARSGRIRRLELALTPDRLWSYT